MTKKQTAEQILRRQRRFISECEDQNLMVDRHQKVSMMKDFIAVEWMRLSHIVARYLVQWDSLNSLTTVQVNRFLAEVSNLIINSGK